MSRRPAGIVYLGLALAMSAVTFVGFWFTYFGRILGGDYPDVSTTVHLHGWSFFAWYLLLPLQAWLMRSRNVALHRHLGLASIGLAILMVVTGLVVLSVQVRDGMAAEGFHFFKVFGLPVLSSLLLFAVFYTLAITRRRRAEWHKRFIIVASAAGLGAAAFRLLGGFWDPAPWTMVAGIMGPNIFIAAAMIHDRIVHGSVARPYWYGLAACVSVEGISFLAPSTGIGQALLSGLAALGDVLAAVY